MGAVPVVEEKAPQVGVLLAVNEGHNQIIRAHARANEWESVRARASMADISVGVSISEIFLIITGNGILIDERLKHGSTEG